MRDAGDGDVCDGRDGGDLVETAAFIEMREDGEQLAVSSGQLVAHGDGDVRHQILQVALCDNFFICAFGGCFCFFSLCKIHTDDVKVKRHKWQKGIDGVNKNK